MKLQDQVVSLELAKRLKELGVKQESYFWWKVADEQIVSDEHSLARYPHHANCYAAAFTVAELGEMLPSRLRNGADKEHSEHQFICEKWPNSQWNAAYVCMGCKGNLVRFQADTEADARAKILSYLLENKLIEI